MTASVALQEAILPRMPDLTPALRNAAEYVIGNADSVAMLSLRRIARESSLPPATFSRLATSLGFDTYEELRNLCREDMRHRAGSFAGKAKTLGDQPPGSLLARHAQASIANIETVVASVDEAHLADIAGTLANARNVLAFGALSSRPLVEHVIYSARLALPNWRLATRDSGSIAIALQDVGAHDAVIVLSQSPYARSGIVFAQSAAARGATVVAITDGYALPITAIAHKLIVAPTDSPHFFASEVATVLLFETLLSMVVQRTGKAARDRIASIENENHRSGEYWRG